jgi:hypothetical protein
MRQLAYAWVLLLLLVGCANLTRPANLEQSLAYAQAQVGAAYKTVADLTRRQQIDKPKARDLIRQIDQADASIKASRVAFAAGDLTTAQGRLDAALALLLTVETALGGTSP